MSSPLLSCNREDIENIVRNNVEDYRVMRELLIIKLKDGIIISHTIQRYLYGLNKNYLKFEKMRNNIEILERFKSEITDLKE